jgi:hypothetical protein
MDNLTYQIPDSLIQSAKYIIEKAKVEKEVFRYCVIHLTSTYETSKIMGMDAVFVGLVESYYKPDLAYWADSTLLFKVNDRARVLKPLLIGKKAPELLLEDTLGKFRSMHTLPNPYTFAFGIRTAAIAKKWFPKWLNGIVKINVSGMLRFLLFVQKPKAPNGKNLLEITSLIGLMSRI